MHQLTTQILVSSSVLNKLTSEHFVLRWSLRISENPSFIKSSFRNINVLTGINWHQKSTSIVNQIADTFHHCVRGLLDKHSPISSKLMQVRKCSPWYNSINDLLQDAKMKRLQAERHWLTSGLTVYREIYVTSKRPLLKSSMMPNILAPKLLIAQTANNFFMSLINSWEDINHHLFLPQFL